MPKKEKSSDQSFQKKSEAWKAVRLEARIVDGPIRIDLICGYGGSRCGYQFCRVLNRIRPVGLSEVRDVVRDVKQAVDRMKGHVKSAGHDGQQHHIFSNVFYQVCNYYTYNGITTNYVLVQNHPGGHPSLGETRNHFHVRPAWIKDGEFRYNDTATPALDNFTPSEHYYYEEIDMKDCGCGCGGFLNEDEKDKDNDKDKDAGGRSNERGYVYRERKCKCGAIGVVGLAAKTGVKYAGVEGAKAGGKSYAKKIPLVGLGVGIGFGVVRLFQGDPFGAALEVASGAASCQPGVGTAASVVIDVALAGRDVASSVGGNQVAFCQNCKKFK